MNQAGITIIAAVHDLQSAQAHFSSSILLRPDSTLVSGPSASILTAQAIEEVFGVSLPRCGSSPLAYGTSMQTSSSCATSPEEDQPFMCKSELPGNVR
jgi:ABC-type cobalamin/Fe3+-siderophores transport system ATPase subunit